jgi:cobalamin biosynthesis protein CobD/CbiB
MINVHITTIIVITTTMMTSIPLKTLVQLLCAMHIAVLALLGLGTLDMEASIKARSQVLTDMKHSRIQTTRRNEKFPLRVP